LIAVARTANGWRIRQDENELGYYSSLPDTMDVVYSEERKTNSHGKSEQRNSASNDGGSS
jgi:hypothetical protein